MGAVRGEPWENNLEGMAASVSGSVPGCQDSCPKAALQRFGKRGKWQSNLLAWYFVSFQQNLQVPCQMELEL